MKIIYLTSIDPDQSNAPANHVNECVDIMARDHEVTLLHATRRMFLKTRFHKNHIRKPILFPHFRGGWRYFERRVSRFLRRRNCEEGTLLYMRVSPSSVLATVLSSYGGMKAMELNGLEVMDSPHFEAMADSVDLLLVGTDVSRTIAVERFPLIKEKVFVHSNVGIDVNNFHPKLRSEARKTLGIPAEDEVIVHVSGFQQHHDFDTLLLAIEGLRPRRPRLKLLLVGNGPRRVEVEKQAEKLVAMGAVVFVGEADVKRLSNYVAATDVCVNVMTKEKLHHGNLNAQKTYEYIACERAVVESCDFSNPIPEWARNSIFLVPPEDVGCLMDALDSTIREREEWEKKVGSVRSELLASHSWATVVGGTLEIVTHAIARGRNTP